MLPLLLLLLLLLLLPPKVQEAFPSHLYRLKICHEQKINFEKRVPLTCIERRLEPLFERDNSGGRRLVAPRPANKLFSSDGDLAQINAWNDDTVKTPNLFNMFLVGRDTCVNKLCKIDRNTYTVRADRCFCLVVVLNSRKLVLLILRGFSAQFSLCNFVSMVFQPQNAFNQLGLL